MPLLATTTGTNPHSNVPIHRLTTHGLLAAIVAMAVNGVILLVAIEALGIPAGFPLSWGPVLASSAVPALVATAVYGVLTRVTRRPNRAFVGLATIVLALSFVPFATPPPELAAASTSVFVTLGSMHVAAAATIVALLTRVPLRDGSHGGLDE